MKESTVMNNQKASLLFTILLLLSMLTMSAKAAQPLDQIAAVVNNDVIMNSEVVQRASLLKRTNPKEVARLSAQALAIEALEDLILERLQLQQAKERGITIDDVTLNRTIERIAQNNKLNLPQFRQALIREGINYENYRKQIRNKMISESLRKRQVDRNINITDQEIEDLIISQSDKLNQGVKYNIQHILVAAPNGTSVGAVNVARKKAEALRKRILAGEDFSVLAKTSSDSHAAATGGNLGWQQAEKLPTSFVRALSLLPVGAVSDVVRDPRGFHIIKLLNKQGGKQKVVNASQVKHILIKVDELMDNATAQAKINAIYQDLQKGADFAQYAKSASDDKGSAARGGDLGWVSPEELVPNFAKVMQQQPLNTLSRPFRSKFGWHVLMVTERQQRDQTGDLLKANAQEFLGNRKLEEEYQVWLQRLKDEAYIEYRPPYGNAIRLQ